MANINLKKRIKQLQPIEKEIINFLKNKGAKAIILVGSRAVGDYDKKSDWDMFIFSKNKTEPTKFKEENLDITTLPLNTKYSWEIFGLKLRFHRIILDTKGRLAKKIVNSAFKLYKKGPKKWSKKYAFGRIEKAERYSNKFVFLLKKKRYNHLFLRICWHFTENSINWWFGIRKEWPLRPQQAFGYIKKKDPEYYKQLKRIFSETSYKEKINAYKKLHKIFFESKEFKKLIR